MLFSKNAVIYGISLTDEFYFVIRIDNVSFFENDFSYCFTLGLAITFHQIPGQLYSNYVLVAVSGQLYSNYVLVAIFCQLSDQFHLYSSVGSKYSQNRSGFPSENITIALFENSN